MARFHRWKQCRHGMMLYNVNDRYVGRSLELYGEFSQGEVELFAQVVRPGDVVVEAGANIGAHTLFFANQVGPKGRVIAFEPQRLAFQALCANMALNSIAHAHCHDRALGREPGTLVAPYLDPAETRNFGGLGLRAAGPGEPVEVTTLDALAWEQCRLIKVDVEGMEAEVLAGAEATIRRLRPFLYVENDRADRSDDLIRLIDDLGYAMYWHRPALFNPNNYLKNPENVFGTTISRNMLCLPKGHNWTLDGFRQVEVPAAVLAPPAEAAPVAAG